MLGNVRAKVTMCELVVLTSQCVVKYNKFAMYNVPYAYNTHG